MKFRAVYFIYYNRAQNFEQM